MPQAPLDAVDEMAGVLLEAQREHDQDDADLGETLDEGAAFDRENTGIDTDRAKRQEPEDRCQLGLAGQQRGQINAAPDDGQMAEFFHAPSLYR